MDWDAPLQCYSLQQSNFPARKQEGSYEMGEKFLSLIDEFKHVLK